MGLFQVPEHAGLPSPHTAPEVTGFHGSDAKVEGAAE